MEIHHVVNRSPNTPPRVPAATSDPPEVTLATPNVQLFAVATAVVSTTMLAAQLLYVRAEVDGYADASFAPRS